MGELVDPTHSRINHSSLSSMRVSIFQGHLRNESMDVDEVMVQSAVTNDTSFNTLLDITQQNALTIQNL